MSKELTLEEQLTLLCDQLETKIADIHELVDQLDKDVALLGERLGIKVV